MKSVKNRILEYIKYHKNGDCQCNSLVLKEYCKEKKLNTSDIFLLVYFFSITYSVASSIFMFINRNEIFNNIPLWVKKNKKNIVFQSDRKYMSYKNRFEILLHQYKKIKNQFLEKNFLYMDDVLKEVQKWEQFGRFSSFLFVETFMATSGAKYINSKTIDWEHGDTVTSGILNVFGYDRSADFFDKNNKLPLNIMPCELDKMLRYLQEKIRLIGGDDNTSQIETSLCAYRKHYKGTRYNGYYLDRQLEEILFFNKKGNFELTNILFTIRGKLFNAKYLGEKNNWDGVRKHLKKIYINTGEIL